MAKLEILRFPDPRLRKKGKPVDKVTPELQKLADDMIETMYAENGIGLAAAQVNEQVRLLVIDTRPKHVDDGDPRYEVQEMTELEKQVEQPLVIFNPVIKKKEDKTTYEEGCLSVPTYFETVERAKYVEVEALDRDGNPITIKTDGLLSICIQHEIDHLDGKVFIDRLSPIKANRLKSKIKKLGYPDDDEDETEETEDQMDHVKL